MTIQRLIDFQRHRLSSAKHELARANTELQAAQHELDRQRRALELLRDANIRREHLAYARIFGRRVRPTELEAVRDTSAHLRQQIRDAQSQLLEAEQFCARALQTRAESVKQHNRTARKLEKFAHIGGLESEHDLRRRARDEETSQEEAGSRRIMTGELT